MARRGERLREHILWTAKDVFIEAGFERTSMDAVAARAETSKRSLYAHFASKDVLFGAVVGLVRDLYLGRLGVPADQLPTDRAATDADAAEAVVRYCGRFLQMLVWTSSLRTLRLGVAEAERLPRAAADYHEAIFATPEQRLVDFLLARWTLDPDDGREIARRLVGRAVYPELVRRLLGVTAPLTEPPDEAALATDVDLASLRALVHDQLGAVATRQDQGGADDR